MLACLLAFSLASELRCVRAGRTEAPRGALSLHMLRGPALLGPCQRTLLRPALSVCTCRLLTEWAHLEAGCKQQAEGQVVCRPGVLAHFPARRPAQPSAVSCGRPLVHQRGGWQGRSAAPEHGHRAPADGPLCLRPGDVQAAQDEVRPPCQGQAQACFWPALRPESLTTPSAALQLTQG